MPRILLVEDSEFNRDMLSRRLVRHGFEVLIAVDGLAGVAMATAQRPDLVLMDLSLPGIDGWEATRRLKADPATQAIPVIALTAHAMSDDRARALAAGCDEFETKPVDLTRLLAKVSGLLGAADTPPPTPPTPLATPATLRAHGATAAPSTSADLTLPAEAASLPAFQAELEHFCRQAGIGSAIQEDLEVVLDEVCANVFRHAYPPGRPGTLQLSLRLLPASLAMTLSDHGRPFNPLDRAPPDLSLPWNERPIGGLGIHLVQQLTDDQRYAHSAEHGNRLTLFKHLGG